MSWNGSPYDDLDHKTGTWMHVYPEYQGEPGGPSTGWQGFREGMDDFKYLYTLDGAIDRARKGGKPEVIAAAEAARKRLNALLATIDYSPRVRGTARWTTEQPSKEGKRLSGTLKVPNGWDVQTYDLARWQAAEATLEIMAALGESGPRPKPVAPGAQQSGPLLSQVSWKTPPKKADAPPASTHPLAVPILGQAPKIDGDLADPVWKQAARVDAFTPNTSNGEPQQQTRAWAFVDDSNLYVAFECPEDKLDYLTASVTSDGGPVALRLVLRDFASGKDLAAVPVTQTVQPALQIAVSFRVCTADCSTATLSATVALGEELAADTELQLSLHAANQDKPVRTQAPAKPSGDNLSALLNLAGLAPGEYLVRARLIAKTRGQQAGRRRG